MGRGPSRQIAGILLTAATDLDAHGGLDVDHARLETAATRIEKVRLGQASAAARANIVAAFSASRRAGFDSSGVYGARRPAPAVYSSARRLRTVDDGGTRLSPEHDREPSLASRTVPGLAHRRGRRVADLTLLDLDAYLQHLHAKGLSRVAIRNHINAVRAFIRHAERRGWCTAGLADALHGPHIYREHGLPLGPSWEDVGKLIEGAASDTALNIRDRAILLLFAVYGLRAGEVANLRLEDLDWEHDRLTVRRFEAAAYSRPIPLVPVVGQAIIRYLKRSDRDALSGSCSSRPSLRSGR